MPIIRCSRSLVLFLLLLLPAAMSAQLVISVGFAPPPLPVYAQPACPNAGYMWVPGYWAYGPEGYYWVPGTWVMAPQPGYLWTPGYWGWQNSAYYWHPGYWGPQVGFYGGINYGYGYPGVGYEGGYWRGQQFYYNRSVNNIHITNVNVYNRTVVNNVNVTRVSYNGGTGGVMAQPTAAQRAALNERHVAETNMQIQHQQAARQDRTQWASVNHGVPAVAASAKPAAFHSGGVVGARNAPVNLPATQAHVANAPRPGNANTARTTNNVPRPPERNNAAAPRPATPAREEQRPVAHANQPEPYRASPAPHPQSEPQRSAAPPRGYEAPRPSQPEPQRSAASPQRYEAPRSAPESRPVQAAPQRMSEPRAEPAAPRAPEERQAPAPHEAPHPEQR